MKVLVATDGSDNAMKAVKKALEMAENEKADVVLMAVSYYSKDDFDDMPPGIQEKLEAHAGEALKKAEAPFAKKGVKVKSVVEAGVVPANNIIHRAKTEKADLILLGSTGVTGLKRALPDRVVFTYQGDGDIAAIGTAETIHAANRGESITAIFVNNGVYGMTGGQMAPTTMLGQGSTTTPGGRNARRDGAPLALTQMLAVTQGSAYLARVAIGSPKAIRNAKRALRKAFEIQLQGLGFSLVEALSACPTNWKLDPVQSVRFVEEQMTKVFPLGVIKDVTASTGSGQ